MRVCQMSSVVKRWTADLDTAQKMPGELIYIADEKVWKEHKAVVIRMLDVLCKLRIIGGNMEITPMGVYIDYRLPTQEF